MFQICLNCSKYQITYQFSDNLLGQVADLIRDPLLSLGEQKVNIANQTKHSDFHKTAGLAVLLQRVYYIYSGGLSQF